jgi:hypothetical protein
MAKNNTNKMNQIINNTNLEIYKAKARTIFEEAKQALINDEITMEDLLKLDLEFDKAVMEVEKCKKEQARLNNEQVQHERLLDLAREIVFGEDKEVESDDDDFDYEDYDHFDDDNEAEVMDISEDEPADNDNSHVNNTFGMILGAIFGM